MRSVAASIILGILSVGTSAASPPAAAPAILLDPTGPWNAHYENEVCKLRRTFGPEDNRVSIELARFGPASTMQLALFGNALKPIYAGRSYTIAFGSLHEHNSDRAMTAKDSNGVEVSLIQLPGFGASPQDIIKAAEASSGGRPTTADTQLSAQITTMTIKIKDKPPIILKTGPFGKVYAVWNKCVDAMAVSWGLDPKTRFSTAPIPIGNPGKWIMPKDYPTKALQEYKGGIIYFRMSVDAEGKPTQCAIQRAVNESDFAQATCAVLMKRARFKPALDASGIATPSFWQSSAQFTVYGN